MKCSSLLYDFVFSLSVHMKLIQFRRACIRVRTCEHRNGERVNKNFLALFMRRLLRIVVVQVEAAPTSSVNGYSRAGEIPTTPMCSHHQHFICRMRTYSMNQMADQCVITAGWRYTQVGIGDCDWSAVSENSTWPRSCVGEIAIVANKQSPTVPQAPNTFASLSVGCGRDCSELCC